MTNQLEMVNGVLQPMSDADQAAYDAQQAAWAAAQPAAILAALAAHRYATQTGGCQISLTVNGATSNYLFLTDPNSQFALTGALIAAQANSAYTANWKMADGSFLTLNATQIISAWQQGAAFVQKCFNTEATLIATVAQYADAASICAAFDAGMAS